MSTIQNLFQQAQLAEAAYADLTDAIGSQANLLTALNVANKDQYDGSFSLAQANAFVADWSVVSQQPDTENGFSATLFKNNNTGAYSLAIRGSTPIQWAIDFQDDANLIAADGVAVSQLVDLYNYWQSLTHQGEYPVYKLTTQYAESAELGIAAAAALFPVPGTTINYLQTRSDLLSRGFIIEGTQVYKLEPDVSTNIYTDSLYGMNGDDTLQGNGGNDYLEGGAGHDILMDGDGNFAIRTRWGDAANDARCNERRAA